MLFSWKRIIIDLRILQFIHNTGELFGFNVVDDDDDDDVDKINIITPKILFIYTYTYFIPILYETIHTYKDDTCMLYNNTQTVIDCVL